MTTTENAGSGHNPYRSLESQAFWARAVAQADPLEITGLWRPKWQVRRKQRIVTFGSCFAQHIGRALRARDYRWHVTEPAPSGLSESDRASFNYDVFSCRTGNIYTASLLQQWIDWALGNTSPPEEAWERDGRCFDPFRPAIELGGFASRREMLESRALTIEAFGRALREANLFVFTLGLTESWWHASEGYEYPMCPGTVAGTFDAGRHVFRNQGFDFICERLLASLELIRMVSPKVKVLLTVSPVPLTATMSGEHVLVATMRSKSILRAVAAEIADSSRWVDYFPAYEIIASAAFGGRFYEANKRSVRPEGVAQVMAEFFSCQQRAFGGPVDALAAAGSPPGPPPPSEPGASEPSAGGDDLVCEEELLAAFAGPQSEGDAHAR